MRSVKTVLLIICIAFSAHAELVNLVGDVGRAVEPSITLVESSLNQIVVEVTVPAFEAEQIDIEISPGNELTFDRISIPGCGTLGEEGEPALPLVSVMIALPENVTVGEPVVAAKNEHTFGGYYIYPNEGFVMTENWIELPAFDYNDDPEGVYATNALHPADPYTAVGKTGHLYNQRLARLEFCPFRFNPQTGELRVASVSRLTIPLTPVPGETPAWNGTAAGPFHEDLRRLCLNYDPEGLLSAPSAPNSTAPGSLYHFNPAWSDQDLANQKVDYLVILAQGFVTAVSPVNPGDPGNDVSGYYLDDLLRWRSTDPNSHDNFNIMIAKLDDIIPYMSQTVPPLQRTGCTNLQCGHLLDQFIEKVYELTSADHIPGGKMLYLLLVGDAHIDGDMRPKDGYDFNYDIQSFTMDPGYSFQGYQANPQPRYDIPSVMYDRAEVYTWFDPQMGEIWYPLYSDQPYADVHDGDFYSRFDYNYPGTTDAHDDDDDNVEYVPIFTADPDVSYPELLVGRLTADDTLVNDDETGDNRGALQVMSDICRKIYDFEANPPPTPPGDNYRRDVCIYDGTRDTPKDGSPPNPTIWEGRRNILWYTQRDDMYWDQLGFDVHYQIAWNHTNQEIIDNELTEEVVGFFEADGTTRLGEYIFMYQNHGGPLGWGSTQTPTYQDSLPYNVIGLDEVDEFANGPYYPMVFQLCCSTGRYFEHIWGDAGDEISGVFGYNPRISGSDDRRNICEVLLRDPDGGALAVYGASIGTTRNTNAEAVCHIAELREVERLGQLVLNLGYLRGVGIGGFYEFLAYHLFGDPALHITDQWRDAGKPDLAVIWDRAWIDRYPTSGNPGIVPVHVGVKNLGDNASTPTTATITYYTKSTSGPVTQVGTDTAAIPQINPGGVHYVTAECELPSSVDNGRWLDSSGFPMTFFFECEVDPGDSIDESDEDNNLIHWPDDNTVSYPAIVFNEYWFRGEGGEPEHFVIDDIAEDPCEPSEVWFFPNADSFPDRLAFTGDSATLPYIVTAELQPGDNQGVVVLCGHPYLIDVDGINSVSWAGLGNQAVVALAVGELDGDSGKEIVGVSSQKVYAWNPDGSAVSGWPVSVLEGGYSFGNQLVLTDVDNDNHDEVAVIDHDNLLPYPTEWNAVLLDNTGTQTPIWRKDIDDEDTTAILVSAGNLNGTAGSEILVSRLYYVQEGSGEHIRTYTYNDLFAWDSLGNNVLADTCYTIPKYHCDYPLVCDYDDDGTVELLVTALDGLVDKVGYAYNTTSSSPETGINAFKPVIGGNQQWPWVAANVTSDGGAEPEFFCGVQASDRTAEQFPFNETVFNESYMHEGYTGNLQNYSPVIADFDPLLDSKPDIAFGCIDGHVFLGKCNREEPEDPETDLFPTGLRFYIDPRRNAQPEWVRHLSIADLDEDGYHELLGVTNRNTVVVWETGCSNASDILWEQYLHDAGHSNYSDDW